MEGFNTQPPEGGWVPYDPPKFVKAEFQHTAARRRLDNANTADVVVRHVSTHSRPKAAGNASPNGRAKVQPFQHTAARRRLAPTSRFRAYTRPFQHTAARRRLDETEIFVMFKELFQHTAARRRLARFRFRNMDDRSVSTHSRPKAAG